MTTRAEIVNEARTWLGTPFKHQGRIRGRGVDCVGLPIVIGRKLGLLSEAIDFTGYAREPHDDMLPKKMAQHMRVVCSALKSVPHGCGCKHDGLSGSADITKAKPGDVLLMRFLNEPQHVGIYTDAGTIIHAYEGVKNGCVEHRLDARWTKRVMAIFTWHRVTD